MVAAGVALVAVGTLSGIGLSPDSISYVSAARSLLAGRGLDTWYGEPFVDWPPLYPLLLAGLGATGLEVTQGARLLALAAHGGLVWLAASWLARRTVSPRVAWAATVALLAAFPLLGISVWAWSEPLFLLFALASLMAVAEAAHESGWRWLGSAAALAAAAALTRYVGVAVMASGGLFLLLRGPRSLRVRCGRVLAFGLVAAAPLALWLARNQAVSGTLAGERAPGQWGLGFNLSRVLIYLSTWALPPAGEGGVAAAASGLLLVLIGASLWVGAKALRSDARTAAGHEREPLGRAADAMVVFSLFVGAYVAMIVWTGTTMALDVIDHRLMAPAFPPAVLAVALGADRALAATGPGRSRCGRLLASTFALWLALAAAVTTGMVAAGSAGLGYRSPRWQASEVLSSLRGPPPGVVYSNDAPAVYYFTGAPARWGPRRHFYNSPQTIPDDITPIREARSRGEEINLVWFYGVPPYFMDRSELEAALPLYLLTEAADGVVYGMR